MIQWKSVEDELPTKTGDYLVAFGDGTVMSFDYTDLDIKRRKWGYLGADSTLVVYWAELPIHPDAK